MSNKNNTNKSSDNCSLSFTTYDAKIKAILKKLDIYEDKNKDLYDELYQAGMLGFIEAINSYTPNNENPIRVHIQNNIINSMLKTYYTKLKLSGYSTERLSLINFEKLISGENIKEDSDSFNNLISFIPSSNNTEEEALKNIYSEEIIKLIPLLLPIEQYVLTHIYGLFGNTPKTYRKIATLLNIKFHNVNYIHKQALKTLRELYKQKYKSPFRK